ncbi:hypothetical protein CW706_01500 [Candidatus Bathyarchaeota archaeon]|nr:MAG: hypothetical protein CW706_01500 [Candidatus Bathyarchaeota archaeon]
MLENEPNDELAQRILAETLALGIINMMFFEHLATADINILHCSADFSKRFSIYSQFYFSFFSDTHF